MRLTVRVMPRGGRDAVEGWGADEAGRPFLKVRVAAAPVDGGANAAVEALVAKALRLPKAAVLVARGQTARLKQLEIDGATPADIAFAFGEPPAGVI